MKKRPVLLIITILILVLVFFYFKDIYGRMKFRWNRDTPHEFLSHVVATKQVYAKDRNEILQQFEDDLRRRIDFFYDKKFDTSTQIIVDTILYSPDFKRVAVFVLTKNSTSKQIMPETSSDWYYDATCYLGTRQKDTLNLSWMGPNFTNSINKKDLINTVKDYYFRLIATEKNSKPQIQFNLNDVRFWNDPLWKEVDKKQRDDKLKN